MPFDPEAHRKAMTEAFNSANKRIVRKRRAYFIKCQSVADAQGVYRTLTTQGCCHIKMTRPPFPIYSLNRLSFWLKERSRYNRIRKTMPTAIGFATLYRRAVTNNTWLISGRKTVKIYRIHNETYWTDIKTFFDLKLSRKICSKDIVNIMHCILSKRMTDKEFDAFMFENR